MMRQLGKFAILAVLGAPCFAAPPAMARARVCSSAAHPHHGHYVRPGPVVGFFPAAPYPDEAPEAFPVGYDGSSATPTGYGVVYNVPPAPQILYVTRHPDFPRENGVIVIRGGVVSAAY